MSVLPANRIHDIIRRMEDNMSQSEAVKTCFGILAIMSREESNKQNIAKDGMEVILNAMTAHVDKCDVQESGCDLLWSLAFNNNVVKETIAKYGGPSVLVRALKRHNRSADFLKSACGALSNMCQCRQNQDGVASQGGLQPLVGAIHSHQANGKLLPFIFDAIASLIVGNEENARSVSTLGFIPLVTASLSKHKAAMEVVKSGCHALAILSDIKGQASKVAFAGGVPVILSLLDNHPSYADLHRVAAVVMLRMLQESNHVAREITCHEGVRILLKSLDKGGAQQDTVAAVTHILFTVTNPSSPSSAAIEPQLWLPSKNNSSNGLLASASVLDAGSSSSNALIVADPLKNGSNKTNINDLIVTISNKSAARVPEGGSPLNSQTALGGLVNVLGVYCERRDVVRAACRLLNNIGGFPGVINALEKLNILDRILECASIHKETKDVVESTTAILKAINRRSIPVIQASKGSCIHGLLHVFRAKTHDEEAVIACSDLIAKHIDAVLHGERKKETDDFRLASGKFWEVEVLAIVNQVLNRLISQGQQSLQHGIQQDDDAASVGSLGNSSRCPANSISMKKSCWSKYTPRMVQSVLTVVENIVNTNKLPQEASLEDIYYQLRSLADLTPPKLVEVSRRIDKILNMLYGYLKLGQRGIDDPSKPVTTITNSNMGGAESLQGSTGGAMGSVSSDVAQGDGSTDFRGESIEKMTSKSMSSIDTGSSNRKGNDFQDKAQFKSSSGHDSTKSNNNSSNSNKSNSLPSRLLDCWPNYLERLLMAPNPMNNGIGNPLGNQTGINVPERMHLVYECASIAGRNIQSRCPTPVPYSVPQDGLGDPFEHSLTFSSEFESGNLLSAVQRGDAVYDLFLRADLHTGGHTQWFYFSVSNTHPVPLVRLAEQGVQVPPVRVRFNIVNLTKPDSLFNLGMRPVIYSQIDATSKGIGWVRAGTDICYYPNAFCRSNNAGEGVSCYFTLSFTVEFHNPKDTVLIAYSYPFTVNDHKYYLNQILRKHGASDIIRPFKLCATLGGDDCDLLVITNFKDRDRIGPLTTVEESNVGSSKKTRERSSSPKNLKPALFLSGRVHPGEPPASWMMKGILDFLTSSSPQAQLIRQSFVIFVVPMLNPDGVLVGNNRCGLGGVDLNRQWKLPQKAIHPTVYYLKMLMTSQRKIRDIYMYIDLHGHSRKYNVFMYGCDDKKKPKPIVREFPKMLSLHSVGRKYVSFNDCSFHIKKGRESTARVVVSKELNIPYSYTLEATFCGSNYGPLKHCHMNIGHLQEVGASLCDAIFNYAISEGYVKDVNIPRTLAPIDALMPSKMADFEEENNNFGSNGPARSVSKALFNPSEDDNNISHSNRNDEIARDIESDSEDSEDEEEGYSSSRRSPLDNKRAKSSDSNLNMPSLPNSRASSKGGASNQGRHLPSPPVSSSGAIQPKHGTSPFGYRTLTPSSTFRSSSNGVATESTDDLVLVSSNTSSFDGDLALNSENSVTSERYVESYSYHDIFQCQLILSFVLIENFLCRNHYHRIGHW